MKQKKKKIKNSLHERLIASRPTVLSEIEKDPKVFFKALKRYFKSERAYSKIMPRWAKAGFVSRVKDLKDLDLFPGEVTELVNIIRAIDDLFPPDGKVGYGNKTIVEIAIIIHKVYGRRIRAYMAKKFGYRTDKFVLRLTKKQALAEQKARGFIHLKYIDIDPEKPYIKSIANTNYVWEEQWENLATVYENLVLIGVQGYTAINLPNKYKR